MNDPAVPQDSEQPAFSAEQQLPPVQPPAGSFLVQLFVIPLLIVSMIVAVWLMFSWLARSGTDPQQLVQEIERLNHASWQKALTLAQQLRDPRNSELRHDQALADRLSDLLLRQIEEGSDEKERRMLRIYLCRALGEFDVDTGYQALATAATSEKRIADTEVRRAALQAIGLLSDRLDPDVVASHEEALQAVLTGTDEYAEIGDEKIRRELLRSTSAYVLGLIPGETATRRLVDLLDDPSLDVSYNAAIGLARRGDKLAIPVLVEMLDPPAEALINPDPSLTEEEQAGQLEWKRSLVISSALQSIGKMLIDHPSLDMEAARAPVQALAQDKSQPSARRIQAQEILRVFNLEDSPPTDSASQMSRPRQPIEGYTG